MAKLGKRTRSAREAFAGKENVTVAEAVALIKANSNAKVRRNAGNRDEPWC